MITKITLSLLLNGIDRGLVDVNWLSLGVGLEHDISSGEAENAYVMGFWWQRRSIKGLGVWVDYQNLLHDEGSNNAKANIVSAGLTCDFYAYLNEIDLFLFHASSWI